MFNKILIANRGEIAVRIIRACKELDIKTVAVYSSADADSIHTKLADEAVCIGPAPSRQSYLNIASIISAAEITDVDAIHPGYGFLSENAHFAEVCNACGIVFIGPTAENIKIMGDKVLAKETMRKAGVPIIPGSQSVVKDKDEALKIAQRIRYPVIIKASAGGGGRGMRVAHNDVRLVSAFMTAQAEAEATFGNPSVYIEKYVEKPRHIEFQIIADKHRNIIHLGERDCTVQRRHQKLIEESPSCALDVKLRKRMGEAAVRGAKGVGYINAGTVEFLVDAGMNFYFMEMNTRLQVEHPITEAITGIDIVKEQILIAAGEKLSARQEDIKFASAAIECRINAEDPLRDFMPCPGRIEAVYLPGGPCVRVDSHIYGGYTVPAYYDSLLAKVIAYGDNRLQAIKTMQRALDELIIEPIKTTIPLHKTILSNQAFVRGQIATDFIETLAEGIPGGG